MCLVGAVRTSRELHPGKASNRQLKVNWVKRKCPWEDIDYAAVPRKGRNTANYWVICILVKGNREDLQGEEEKKDRRNLRQSTIWQLGFATLFVGTDWPRPSCKYWDLQTVITGIFRTPFWIVQEMLNFILSNKWDSKTFVSNPFSGHLYFQYICLQNVTGILITEANTK